MKKVKEEKMNDFHRKLFNNNGRDRFTNDKIKRDNPINSLPNF